LHPLVVLVISVALVVLLIMRLKINAFLAMIAAAILVGLLSSKVPLGEVVSETARTFGTVAGNIGIVIALAAIIGQCLMESGAADRIVRRFVSLLGPRYSSLSLLISGFVLAVPVFFDTVFYLLIPLARAMRVRTGRNYVLFVMAICAGGTVTHCLVPPTPGPLAIATTMGIDLGTMILLGLVIGIPTSAAGWLFARLTDRRLHIEFRETPGLSMQDLETLAAREEKDLPGFWLSIAPILLPVALISSHTIARALDREGFAASLTGFIGNPNFALLISTAVALYTLARQKDYQIRQLSTSMESALSSGGLIILITSAGGAYGGMLVRAGVGDALQRVAHEAGIPLIVMGFLMSSLMRISQGSSTVAMITTASIVAPTLQTAHLAYHPAYVAVAIAGGALVGSWMNDSGFWIYKQMAGFTELEALKTWTPLVTLLGTVAFLAAVAGSLVVPLR
jgi:GntP family gluconate:H+ symporter